MAGLINDVLNTISGGGYDKSIDIQEQMLQEARALPLPILKEYYPELYKQVVSLNPELETAVELGPSSMEGVFTDPNLRKAQMNALLKLQEIGDAGGRDSQFLSDANRLQNDINTNLQGQTGAIEQNMAARGLSGGMSELVSKQIAAQGAANRQADSAMELKAQADRRALESLMQSGQLAGQMQSQEFDQQSRVAEAKDAIERFNTQNRQNVINSNVAAKNTAQQWNANTAQNTSNSNVDTRNKATQYNLNLPQQQYENELKKRGIVAGAQQGLANSYQNEADRNRQFVGGLISSGMQAYGTKGAK